MIELDGELLANEGVHFEQINDVEQSFQAAKKMKADTLGFGEEFHRAYPHRAGKDLESYNQPISRFNCGKVWHADFCYSVVM
jgi:hypothetical protein